MNVVKSVVIPGPPLIVKKKVVNLVRTQICTADNEMRVPFLLACW